MLDATTGLRRKIIIFTEPLDALDYLAQKIGARIGEPAAIVVIHGGIACEARRAAIAAFNSDPVRLQGSPNWLQQARNRPIAPERR